MKRTALLMLTLALCLLAFCACGGKGGKTTPPETTPIPPVEQVTILDGTGSLVLVMPKSPGNGVRTEAMNLRGAIGIAVGVTPTLATDASVAAGVELVFGNTSRPISALAAERIEEHR